MELPNNSGIKGVARTTGFLRASLLLLPTRHSKSRPPPAAQNRFLCFGSGCLVAADGQVWLHSILLLGHLCFLGKATGSSGGQEGGHVLERVSHKGGKGVMGTHPSRPPLNIFSKCLSISPSYCPGKKRGTRLAMNSTGLHHHKHIGSLN